MVFLHLVTPNKTMPLVTIILVIKYVVILGTVNSAQNALHGKFLNKLM